MELQINWDIGTAYDLFVSLRILHVPKAFGLRPKWASGMRSRLSNASRETLMQAETLLFVKRPSHWVATLPEPRDGATILTELAKIAPGDRLSRLVFTEEIDRDVKTVLMTVAKQGSWDSTDSKVIQQRFRWWTGGQPSVEEAARMLDLWSQAAQFGEQYLAMLQEYYEVFFAEEERRIRPFLETALVQAQTACQTQPFAQFLAETIGGIGEKEIPPGVTQLTLAPSYWVTPYAFLLHATPEHFIITFRARPPGASLVPGEDIPDMMVRALKAIADPTRLRILQYLTGSPATPTQLARRLRLRTSTIGHHIKQLQVAGLVRASRHEGKEIQYVARIKDLDTLFDSTRSFMIKENEP